MSVSYGPLAERYDLLTSDVPYDALCDYYETALKRCGRAVRTVLDLGCGTGTLSLLLARRGYELIAADASPDMLSIFQSKLADLPEGVTPPMLLCQRAEELDLYDTVDAAVCCLDGFNYLSPGALSEAVRRLHLFLSPDGIFHPNGCALWTGSALSTRTRIRSACGEPRSTAALCATEWTCSAPPGGCGGVHRKNTWNISMNRTTSVSCWKERGFPMSVYTVTARRETGAACS